MKKGEIRDKLFAEAGPYREKVNSLGTEFYLERIRWEDVQLSREAGKRGGEWTMQNHLIALLIMSAEDEDGKKLFEQQDYDRLRLLPPGALDHVTKKLMSIHGMGNPELDSAVKNLKGTGSGDQSSTSVENSENSPANSKEESPTS